MTLLAVLAIDLKKSGATKSWHVPIPTTDNKQHHGLITTPRVDNNTTATVATTCVYEADSSILQRIIINAEAQACRLRTLPYAYVRQSRALQRLLSQATQPESMPPRSRPASPTRTADTLDVRETRPIPHLPRYCCAPTCMVPSVECPSGGVYRKPSGVARQKSAVASKPGREEPYISRWVSVCTRGRELHAVNRSVADGRCAEVLPTYCALSALGTRS